jgi:hypothetical protein
VLSLNSRIVDEAIHGTELFGHLFRGALERHSVGDIEGVGFDTRVSLADFPEGFDAPSRYYDSGALAGERLGEPSANSGAATGYEAAFAGKCHGSMLALDRRFASSLSGTPLASFSKTNQRSLEASEAFVRGRAFR